MEFFQEHDFYLSDKECDTVNKLCRVIEFKHKNNYEGVKMIWDNIVPHTDMSDAYYIKE